jgi:transcriptional regulator
VSRFVTVSEAAKILKCTRANVYQIMKRHGIEAETRTERRREVIHRTVSVKYINLDDIEKALGIQVEDNAAAEGLRDGGTSEDET